MVAVTAILAAFVFAALRYDTATDVSTALAAITGTVGTILGAYLGVQTGSQGKEEAEAARQKAEARAVALAAAAPYEQAREALRWSKDSRSRPGLPVLLFLVCRLQDDLAVLFPYRRPDRG